MRPPNTEEPVSFLEVKRNMGREGFEKEGMVRHQFGFRTVPLVQQALTVARTESMESRRGSQHRRVGVTGSEETRN